jgi:hypothetical protein
MTQQTPTLAGFHAFCAGKPANEKYDWFSVERNECGCPARQYLHDIGRDDMAISDSDDMAIASDLAGRIPLSARTFGALLVAVDSFLV